MKALWRSLRTRLLLTYLAVLLVSVGSLAATAYVYASARLSGDAQDAGGQSGGRHVFLGVVEVALVGAGLAGIALGAGLGVAFAGSLTKPIRDLSAASRRLAAGEYDGPVSRPSVTELGELADAFNAMAADVAKTEQLRRDLIVNVSHELRTPLTALQGNLEAMRDGIFVATPEALGEAHDEVVRVAHVVADLQELSLAEAGLAVREVRPVDVSATLRAAALRLEAGFRAKGVALELALPTSETLVVADEGRLGQVVNNLLTNALKFSLEGARVLLRAREADGEVRIEVADEGAGLRAEDLDRVFDRFYRVANGRGPVEGTGVGLAIARALVSAQGGRMWAESPGLGEGATFCVALRKGE